MLSFVRRWLSVQRASIVFKSKRMNTIYKTNYTFFFNSSPPGKKLNTAAANRNVPPTNPTVKMATMLEARVSVLETEMRNLKRAASRFLNPPPMKKRRLDDKVVLYMDDSVVIFEDGTTERPSKRAFSPFTQTQPLVDPSVLGPC
jgi:hypothetical protein